MTTVRMNHYFEEAEREYDPENDMRPGIQVTWVDKALLDEVRRLAEKMGSLEKRVADLERGLRSLSNIHP